MSASESKDDSKALASLMKFPRTPHLADLGGKAVTRDDLLFSTKDATKWLDDGIVTVEEKVDGANMGISIDPESLTFQVQNRSHFVNSSTARQFARLDDWLSEHAMELHGILKPGRHILFGEWLALRHSVHYTALPDTFLAFDIWDGKHGKFLSKSRRDRLLAKTSIRRVRCVARRRFPGGVRELAELLERTPSAYCKGRAPMEGVYLRREMVGCDECGTERAAVVVERAASGAAGDPAAGPVAPAGGAGVGFPVVAAGGGSGGGASKSGGCAGGGGGRAAAVSPGCVTSASAIMAGGKGPRWLESRCKLVRSEFVAGIEGHWSKGEPVKNVVLVGEELEQWNDAEEEVLEAAKGEEAAALGVDAGKDEAPPPET